jgi:hypothetical protein
MDDRKTLLERMMGATEETVSRVQSEVAQSTVVAATRERASAVRQRAQAAALSQLPLATQEDIARLQAQLDRVEAALADLSRKLPDKPTRTRTTRSKTSADK